MFECDFRYINILVSIFFRMQRLEIWDVWKFYNFLDIIWFIEYLFDVEEIQEMIIDYEFHTTHNFINQF